MNDVPAHDNQSAATTMRLVPADDRFLAAFLRVAEPLLSTLTVVIADADIEPENAWLLPPALVETVPAARDAWDRIWQALGEPLRALARTGEMDVEHTRSLRAPGGAEHTPLYPVHLDPADLETLHTVLRILNAALAGGENPDLRETLHAAAEELTDCTAQSLVADLTLTLALLDMPLEGDLGLLAAVVLSIEPGHEILLTAQEEAAYQRLATHYTTLTGGDAIGRYFY